jgi:hypothetical protein
MDRRDFLRLPLAVTVAVLATGAMGLQPASAATLKAIKGIGYGGTDYRTKKRLGQLNLDWYYNWSPSYGPYSTNFIPMIRDNRKLDRDLTSFYEQYPSYKPQYLLGFNEPDHKGQANLTVDQALALWPRLEATGLRLGSPATISPNAEWMNSFMTKAKNTGRRVDFVTMHCYQWPKASSFFAKLDSLHDRWGLPIWVTEYAVADWNATSTKPSIYSRAQTNEYMIQTVEGMRKRPFVERFAWKTRDISDPKMGNSALFHTDGALTSTGKIYASL